ncbi:MAG: hypothetical protein IKA71_04790 [Lentisphaeria bacterium]|nr:hypothetical protein [Lentisphaeria bacterium]
MKRLLFALMVLGCTAVSASGIRLDYPVQNIIKQVSPFARRPVKPGHLYESHLKIFINNASPAGSLVAMDIVQYDADGNVVARAADSSKWVYEYGMERNIRYKFTTHAKAAVAQPIIYYGGNPWSFTAKSWELDDKIDVQPGIYGPDDPMPADRAKALEEMKKITPATAEVVKRNGVPALMVNGKQLLLNAYKGHTDYKITGEAGGDLIITFNCGQRLFTNERWDKALWDYETGKFDFTRMEDNLLRIHNANPNARVILCIDVTPDKFMEKFPDSIVRNAKGVKGKQGFTAFDGWSDTPLKGRQRWAFSYASKEIQDFINGALTELATFLKNSPAGNIVIGFHLAGGMDGQFVQWEYGSTNGHFDYSEANRKALCEYLKEIYGTDEALQKAWGDPKVTLATAANPTIEEFRSLRYFNDRPGLGRKIADCRRFVAIGTARFINGMGKTLKKAWGRPAVVLSWYSTAIWAQPSRLALDELIKDGAVNMTGMVSNYGGYRSLNGFGCSANSCVQALNLRNVMYIQEMDHRTWRAHRNKYESISSIAFPDNPQQYKNQMYRDAASVIALGGQGFYLYDMYGSWYHDPAAKEVLRDIFAMNTHAQKYAGQFPKPRVAIFMDESMRLLSEEITMSASECWRTGGVVPALHFISDLTNPELPEYDFYLLWSPPSINKKQLDALKKFADKPGKVVFIHGDVARCSRDFADTVDFMKQLGLQLKFHDTSNGKRIVPAACNTDPALMNVTHYLGSSGFFIDKGSLRRRYYFGFTSIDDPDAKILGHYENSDLPAFAVKKMPGGGLLYYAGRNAVMDSQLFHNLCKVAGIHTYSVPGNAVYVGNGIAAIHRLSTTEPVVDFGKETTLIDPVSGKNLGKMRYWRPQVAHGECAVVGYLPEGK